MQFANLIPLSYTREYIYKSQGLWCGHLGTEIFREMKYLTIHILAPYELGFIEAKDK